MNAIKETVDLDMKSKLSTLWIFVFLNMLFRDVHELFRPGYLQEIMTGTVNGIVMSEQMLLAAGMMLEIGILMVVLARFLAYRANRWANILTGAFMIASTIYFGVNDLDDIFFAVVEVLALLAIIWLSWRWPRNREVSIPASGPAGVHAD
jgi:hypothetical protein